MASRDNMPGTNRFGIGFELDDLENVSAWGDPGACKLHWFGLTSGRYWIETPSGSLLEYTSAIQKSWSLPGRYPDYYVARPFEDLVSLLPAILEPVPTDIAAQVSDPSWRAKGEQWCDRGADEDRWRQWYAATRWWYSRCLDMGHLRHAPRFTFWRVEETLFLQWKADDKENGVPVWTLPEGQTSVSVVTFEAAIVRFCEELLDLMEQRVGSIQQEGWKRTDCTLNVDALAQEHSARREFLQKTRQEKAATDWQNVRTSLEVLLPLVEKQSQNST